MEIPRVRWAAAVGLSVVLSLALAPGAGAAQQIIASSGGPLTQIWLNDNLGCQADHSGDTSHEFFGGTNPGSCGTYLSAAGTSFGPRTTGFTPVSQSGVTGAGTSGNPFKVVTVVAAGATGLGITQTDTYVAGQESYRTDITVSNSGRAAVAAALYHAADCFLQNSDRGFGFFDSSTQGIFCSANPNNSPPGRVIGFSPLSAGAHHMEDGYSTVYSGITASGTQFPDTCKCTLLLDNGAGLSWPITVPAGGTVTRSLSTTFSPTGQTQSVAPPVFARAVDVGVVRGTVTIGVPSTAGAASGTPATSAARVKFVRLRGTRQIPVGSFLNTRRGTVRLVSATSTGAQQTGDFNGGVFQVRQARSNRGLTDINLAGSSFRGCRARGSRAGASSSRVIRRVRGRARGRYRTRGRYSAATVRGTTWTVTDRCDGTLTSVASGVVVVHDNRKRRNITVRAHRSYLARAG
jgi:hypothetical protein